MVWQKAVITVLFVVLTFVAIRYLPVGEEWGDLVKRLVNILKEKKSGRELSPDFEEFEYRLKEQEKISVE